MPGNVAGVESFKKADLFSRTGTGITDISIDIIEWSNVERKLTTREKTSSQEATICMENVRK